jgi:hypothetical protein
MDILFSSKLIVTQHLSSGIASPSPFSRGGSYAGHLTSRGQLRLEHSKHLIVPRGDHVSFLTDTYALLITNLLLFTELVYIRLRGH